MNIFNKTLLSVALTASLGLANTSAMATVLPDFYVDPNSTGLFTPNLPSYPSPVFQADKINGNYSEVIDFTGATTFNTKIVWTAAAFESNDGATPVKNTGLGGDVAANANPLKSYVGPAISAYGLFAEFVGSGTYSTSGGKTTFLFASSTFDLFLDAGNSAVVNVGATAGAAFNLVNTFGDTITKLGSGSQFGGGSISGNGGTLDATCTAANCGSYGVTDIFKLNGDGSKFFISPSPFFSIVLGSGNFNSFTVAANTTQTANGSADFSFKNAVPEPTSLALLGMGLIGFGLRRKQA